MAQVVHELWIGGDPSIMIMPGSMPLSSDNVILSLQDTLSKVGPISFPLMWMASIRHTKLMQIKILGVCQQQDELPEHYF